MCIRSDTKYGDIYCGSSEYLEGLKVRPSDNSLCLCCFVQPSAKDAQVTGRVEVRCMPLCSALKRRYSNANDEKKNKN